ncbi:MAG: hypothetical protein ACAH59_05695 [Pseudobdellovibrionaceae bacterium]
MDKISSILKGNPRVTSVDLNEAPPARPGAPALGRKAGRNTVLDRVTLSEKAKEIAAQDTLMVRNPKEASRAKMVEEINRKFFETRLKPVEKEMPQSEEIVDNLSNSFETSSLPQDEVVAAYEPKPALTPKLSIEA